LALTSCEIEDVKELLALVADLKNKGLTGGSMAMSLCRRLIQPIKDLVHPAYEYWGQSDPTREVNHKVSRDEMAARVTQMYTGRIRNRKCPKTHYLSRLADPVSPETTRSLRLVSLLYSVRGRPLMLSYFFL
jgi:hypothetical protein